MSLRKNFDSFTPQHKFQDAQNELIEAIYRFRAAEKVNAPDRISLKLEMEFLEEKVLHYRYCIYSKLPIEDYPEKSHVVNKCPPPVWIYKSKVN